MLRFIKSKRKSAQLSKIESTIHMVTTHQPINFGLTKKHFPEPSFPIPLSRTIENETVYTKKDQIGTGTRAIDQVASQKRRHITV